MNGPTNHDPELDALLGAYALDALEDRERAQVEAYLEQNPRARNEVDELRETAAALASVAVSEGAAPPELWNRIASELTSDDVRIGDGPSAGRDELTARRAGRSAPRRSVWVTGTFAAAAAIVAAVLALQVVSLNDEVDDAEAKVGNVAAAFERAQATDGARAAELVAAGSDLTMGRVVVLPDGTGYLLNDNMAPLGEDETYQLWALVGNETDRRVISAGVLGSEPEGTSFQIDGPVQGFAVTVERAGGVEKSDHGPVASAELA